MTDPLAFLTAVVVILITPGPTNTLLMAAGALAGVRRSIALLAAEIGGYLSAILPIGFLLGPWIARTPRFAAALKIMSAIYLLTLAARTWRGRREVSAGAPSFWRVLLTTFLNPKALIFALMIIPMSDPNAMLYVATFAAIVPTIGCLWIVFGSMAGRALNVKYAPLVIRTITCIALACFSALLIVKTIAL
jgi:threonine/homoserine/homoserine lactone efflux protein